MKTIKDIFFVTTIACSWAQHQKMLTIYLAGSNMESWYPHAGRRTYFRDKKSSDFSGENFRERNFGSSITALQLCSHYLAVEWIHFPRIRTFVEKRFHGLFSKKKRSKSGDVPSFPRREHVPAVISLPSGLPTALDPYEDITGWLKIEQELLPEKAVLGQ